MQVVAAVLGILYTSCFNSTSTCFTPNGDPTTLCVTTNLSCLSNESYATAVESIHGTTCHRWSWSCVPLTFAPTTQSPTTQSPTNNPTEVPSTEPPTLTPSTQTPTAHPTSRPTTKPTKSPTAHPSKLPTGDPTFFPTYTPTAVVQAKPPWHEHKGFHYAIAAFLFLFIIFIAFIIAREYREHWRRDRVAPQERIHRNDIYSA